MTSAAGTSVSPTSPGRKSSLPQRRRHLGRYVRLEEGQWYRQPSFDRVACCDCGLVHDVEWRAVQDKNGQLALEMRHSRNMRATAQVRRAMVRRGEL